MSIKYVRSHISFTKELKEMYKVVSIFITGKVFTYSLLHWPWLVQEYFINSTNILQKPY